MSDNNNSNFLTNFYLFSLNIILACLVIFFISCFKYGTASYIPKWARIGLWRMFTYKTSNHSDLRAIASFDDGWKEINLRELFPSKWDSGYRFQRAVFWRNKTRMRMLAASTCVRLEGKATELKFYQDYWKIVPGIPASSPESKKNVKEKFNLHWYCGSPVYTPIGKLVK